MAYRICSISGGGVRGIIPATIIKEMLSISKSLGGKGDITDLCDYVVGTSIGGIIGAGLVVSEDGNKKPKYTPDVILRLLQDNAAEIFPADANFLQQIGLTLASGTFLYSLSAKSGFVGKTSLAVGALGAAVFYPFSSLLDGFFTSKYSREGIDKLLEESFGDLKLADVIIPFTTVSYSLEQSNPRVWSTFKAVKTTKDNLYIKDALGATSAAPTFFPHKVTNVTSEGGREELYYDVDGGIFANSPVNLAIAVMIKHAPEDLLRKAKNEGITVLSIGTGYYKDTATFAPPKFYQEGKFGYGLADPIVLKVMDAAERDSIIQARNVHKTIRLDPKLDKSLMPMDQSDPDHIQSLSKAGVDFVNEHKKIIKEYVECIFYNTDTNCEELVTESTPDYSYEVNYF